MAAVRLPVGAFAVNDSTAEMPPSFLRRLRNVVGVYGASIALVHLAAAGLLVKLAWPLPVRVSRVVIPSDDVNEASGLTASPRAPDLFWTLNDSRNTPVLFAFGRDGAPRGALRIEAVTNYDWEDLASFEWQGRSYLLIGDVGNNAGTRKVCMLHAVAEPDPTVLRAGVETTGTVAWTIVFRYPDGSHDCEAIAVDPREKLAYLLTKRRNPPVLFSVPLFPADANLRNAPPVTASRIGPISPLPQPGLFQKMLPVPTGRYRGQPTGLAFSPRGEVAAVVTYGDVAIFTREPNESWGDALARAPVLLPPHGLSQAEAVSFSGDGKDLLVIGEQKHPPVVIYTDVGKRKSE